MKITEKLDAIIDFLHEFSEENIRKAIENNDFKNFEERRMKSIQALNDVKNLMVMMAKEVADIQDKVNSLIKTIWETL